MCVSGGEKGDDVGERCRSLPFPLVWKKADWDQVLARFVARALFFRIYLPIPSAGPANPSKCCPYITAGRIAQYVSQCIRLARSEYAYAAQSARTRAEKCGCRGD